MVVVERTSAAPSSKNDSNIWYTIAEISLNVVFLYASYRAGKTVLKMCESELERIRSAKESVSRLHVQLQRNNRPLFATNSYEEIIAGDLVDPQEIDVRFDSIGGLSKAKQEIHDLVVLPLKRPDLFKTRGNLLTVPKGVLLYGQPGTGKTMLAKAIARESGAFFINLKMGTIISKWQGESEKLISAVFSLASKLAPCIIFVDEVDNFMGNRSNTHDSHVKAFKTEFMIQWDGFLSDGRHDVFGVVVLGATNRPADIDPAFLRRMPRTFEIGLPDQSQRAQILALQLTQERLSTELDLERVARLTHEYSGSDLKELCRAALLIPMRELLLNSRTSPAVEMRALEYRDFVSAQERVKATGQTAYEYGAQRAGPSSSSAPVTQEMLAAAMMTGMQLGLAARNFTS